MDPALKQEFRPAVSTEITVTPVMQKLIEEPDDSALSHMLHDGMPEDQTRTIEFVLPTLKIVQLGGMQEPGQGAGSIMAGLLQNPDQFAEVKGDLDALLPRSVDEALRWITPIATQTRQTTQAVEIGGVTIPPINRSPPCSPRPRIARAVHGSETLRHSPYEGSHAAFGFGHHFCAGRWFARQQINSASTYLIDKPPEIALRDDGPVQIRGWEFSAPSTSNVTLR
ncbi:cytochrome P450 [Rhizobium sp. NZLR1]|uniref:cytochrome P450 n=1 Tax=Rhizobium sp. NZLR1 TaxID=2731096 RepID=UPI001A984575|nr:cytochrome P450 [Rhizobium sp. NZLR1]QSZ23335.1 cytochrome P450 [Rhizobium sp. NZLR1]